MNRIPTLDVIRRALADALRRLYAADHELIAVDANERSLTHRLGMYLAESFPNWDVDCEYNRDDADPKRLDEVEDRLREHVDQEDPSRDTRGRTVYPDIVVHRRRTHDNLLVIEVKKSSSRIPDDLDRLKVEALCMADRYRYHFGFLIRLPVADGSRPPTPELVFPTEE